jgi:hypothetical protein
MFPTTRNLQIRVRVTQDLNSFREIIAHEQCSVDEEKKNIYILCVPHKNNYKKKWLFMHVSS